jgi:hypothetical protein
LPARSMKVKARQPPPSLHHERDTRWPGRRSKGVPDRCARRGVVDAVNASSPGRHRAAQWTSHGRISHGRSCPCCHGPVYRVPRRFVDRCLSLFMPVHRYRCGEMGCSWEGNLQAQQPPRPSLGPGEPASAGIAAPSRRQWPTPHPRASRRDEPLGHPE